MNQTIDNDMRATTASIVYAITGYIAALLLGSWLADTSTGDFADLAIGSITILVFAPLAALVGSLIAYYLHRPRPLDATGRRLLAMAWIGLGTVAVAAAIMTERVAAIPVLLLGATLLVIVRLALAHRQHRR